jgi:drug/metabolite transporter (DMT)-like permease
MTSSVLGVLSALFSALLWALSGVTFTWMARHLDVLPMNMMRCLFGALFFWLLLPFAGGLAALGQVAPTKLLALIGSVILLLIIGDSLYFTSMRLIGVSRAMPIANSISPLITLTLAITWLNEDLTALNITGSLLTIAGVYLVIRDSRRADEQEPAPPKAEHAPPVATQAAGVPLFWRGVVLALISAFSWGVGLAVLKVGVTGLSAVIVHSIRLPLAAILLGGIIAASGRNLDRVRRLSRPVWLILFANSIIDNFLGNIFLILAFQLAGAGKTATLISTVPLFAVPFSLIILKERPTRLVMVGTVLAVIGIALVA